MSDTKRYSRLSYLVKLLFLSGFFAGVLSGCNSVGENSVTVTTQGALDPVSFYIEGGEEKGEFLVGSDAVIFTAVLKNSNAYELSGISLDIDEFSTASMKFAQDDEGVSSSPGYGGTCGTTLAAGESCTFAIEYNPSFAGELEQKLLLTYKNKVNTVIEEANITLLAGEAASLIFEGEVINYNFGFMERTEPQELVTHLKVINSGGLTAREVEFSALASHNSGAFTVEDNTCGTEIAIGESCSLSVIYLPQNYGPTAPDGDNDLNYTFNPRFDYVKEPSGGKGALTAYFYATSTMIRGDMLSSGVTLLEFEDITVGNQSEGTFKIQNYGYKESIMHYLDIYDASDNHYARCIKTDDSTDLHCKAAADFDETSDDLSLEELPLTFTDTTGCINPYDSLDYTRDELGNLISDTELVTVSGKTEDLPGGSCFFGVIFQPSVEYKTDGNINDYSFRFVFDNTWKNTITIEGGDNSYDSNFTIAAGEWYSAAKLTVNEFSFADTLYTNQDTDDNGEYLYDLGRIALVSSSSYLSKTAIKFKNTGGTDAEIVSISDGATSPFTITDASQHLNTYYRSIYHTCDYVGATSGTCNLRYNLNPLASEAADAEAEENGNMYDILNGYPEQYKVFTVTYRDGSSLLDDGSEAPLKTLTLKTRSLLVRKGYLVFEGSGTATNLQEVGPTPLLYHLYLKNAGTGGISVIREVTGNRINKDDAVASGSLYPYEYVDMPSPVGGADKDCYDFLESDTYTPTAQATNAASVLNAGEVCSLTIKMSLKNNDIIPVEDYEVNGGTIEEKERFYDSDYDGDLSLWGSYYGTTVQESVRYEYYDGDGISDAANGYTADVEGYGNLNLIQEGSAGRYILTFNTQEIPVLYPKTPFPMLNGVICRKGFTYPSYTITADEWGDDLVGYSVNDTCWDYADGTADSLVTHSADNKSYVVDTLGVDYDYIYHAGTYLAGETYNLSFIISNSGIETNVSNVSFANIQGSALSVSSGVPVDTFTAGGSKQIAVDFAPAGDGTYSATYIVTYEDQVRELTDLATETYSASGERTLRIKIIAEAVASDTAAFSAEVQDYLVLYDEGGDPQIDDTQTNGDPEAVNLYFFSSNDEETVGFNAIRNAATYARKVFTFTNDSANTVEDVTFNIKSSVQSGSYTNSPSANGYSLGDNSCSGVSLAAGASCTVEVTFQASLSEGDTAIRYGNLTYKLASGDHTYTQQNFRMGFYAEDPATLVTPLDTENVYSESLGYTIQGSYILSNGSYGEGHKVVYDYPYDEIRFENIHIENTSEQKSSFLYEWFKNDRDPADLPDSAEGNILYSDDTMTVEADRTCFYGDDYSDETVEDDKKGFNASSADSCYFDITLKVDHNDFGQDIDSTLKNITLEFYNFERSSVDSLSFHFKGFVESNPSIIPDTSIADVYTDNTGYATFSWNEASTATPSWGEITGYRVFYSLTKSGLNNIFTGAASYVDTTATSVEINGLTAAKYYYFKIAALRENPDGDEYLSDISMTPIELIIPPSGMFYDYEAQVVIDESSLGETGTKDEGIAACNSETIPMTRNGSTIIKNMKLISSEVYDIIDSDENNSDYFYKAQPHWLSDDPVDISTIFDGFDCSTTSGSDGELTFYIKSCSDCSCVDLSSIVGGDGDEIPYGAWIYAEGEEYAGIFRCYFEQ